MSETDITIVIGGAAGQGIETVGQSFTKALSTCGLRIFGLQDFMSRIRGGHNFYQIRISERPIFSHRDQVDILIAMTDETIDRHLDRIVKGGAVIYDETRKVDGNRLRERGVMGVLVPLQKIAEETGGDRIYTNTAAVGAAAGLLDYDYGCVANEIRRRFERKGEEVVEQNVAVMKEAYDYTRERYAKDFGVTLKTAAGGPRMVMHGNEAVALGALAAGCKFISAYPMTPATTIFEGLVRRAEKYGIVVKQTEDEIAACCMAIGAAHGGVRAMTATSGGGFALMVEALGLAAMSETPLVLALSQRPGPSTGLPTRTEQGDLNFVIHASQGDFPRIVIAPGSIEECFYSTARAFNLAEVYQCPVLILVDNFLSFSLRDLDRGALDIDRIEIDRGELLTDEELDRIGERSYRRYALTESGISPRAVPHHPNGVFIALGNEHTEEGRISEDADNRIRQVDKRARKMARIEAEMAGPERWGPEDAELSILGWGSTCGPIREAVERLNERGVSINSFHFRDLWPFPVERTMEALSGLRRTVLIESNSTSQFGRLLRGSTGIVPDRTILKYDGRPFSADLVIRRLIEEEEIHAG
jgi:2-oxoglutarate ferredoxin oxidoreductase subunit alpha